MTKLPDELQQLYKFFTALRTRRGSTYGPFGHHMKTTAKVWNALLEHWMLSRQKADGGFKIKGWHVAGMFAADKMVRAFSGSAHGDNAVDAAHYFCQMIVMQREASLGKQESKE